MMVLKEQLKDKIATIKREIESFEPAKQQLRRLVSVGRFFFFFLFFFTSFIEIDRGREEMVALYLEISVSIYRNNRFLRTVYRNHIELIVFTRISIR